jgi:hypothetical protein
MGKRLALTAVVVAAVVVIAITTTSNTHSASITHSSSGVQVKVSAQPTSSPPAHGAPGSGRLLAAEAIGTEAVLSEHFDAFLEPRISPTPFPGWLAHRLLHTADAVFPDPAFAVYLAPLAGGWAGWVIPGAHGVCVEAVNDRSHQARGDCGTVVSAERDMLVASYPGPGDTTQLLGLAPDTGTQVELHAGEHAKRMVAITNNAWTSVVPAATRSIAVLGRAGGALG